METLVCFTCGMIYDKEMLKPPSYSKGYICPRITSCGGNLIAIDEILVDVIIKLNRIGAKTLYSCSGHLPIRSYLKSPFVMFYTSVQEPKRGKLTKLREIALDIVKKEKYLIDVSEIEIIKDAIITYLGTRATVKRFKVSPSSWGNDILLRITVQKAFLEFLYKMVDRIKDDKTS